MFALLATSLVGRCAGTGRNFRQDTVANSFPCPLRVNPSARRRLNEIVPTIYEILGIKPPAVVDGFNQDPNGSVLPFRTRAVVSPDVEVAGVLCHLPNAAVLYP